MSFLPNIQNPSSIFTNIINNDTSSDNNINNNASSDNNIEETVLDLSKYSEESFFSFLKDTFTDKSASKNNSSTIFSVAGYSSSNYNNEEEIFPSLNEIKNQKLPESSLKVVAAMSIWDSIIGGGNEEEDSIDTSSNTDEVISKSDSFESGDSNYNSDTEKIMEAYRKNFDSTVLDESSSNESDTNENENNNLNRRSLQISSNVVAKATECDDSSILTRMKKCALSTKQSLSKTVPTNSKQGCSKYYFYIVHSVTIK